MQRISLKDTRIKIKKGGNSIPRNLPENRKAKNVGWEMERDI